MKEELNGHTLNDAAAMALIHELLDGAEWSSDTLEAIGEVVLATGRIIADPNDDVEV